MSFGEAQRKKYIYSRALALPMSDNWPRVTNKREEELSRVANMLFSKGLAASLWDAQEKAKDIIGLGGSCRWTRPFLKSWEWSRRLSH